MALTTEDTKHLPDLTDLLKDRNARFQIVEIAQYRNDSIHQYTLRYVAGTATIDNTKCLVVGYYKTEQGTIIGKEFPLLRTLSEYTPLTK